MAGKQNWQPCLVNKEDSQEKVLNFATEALYCINVNAPGMLITVWQPMLSCEEYKPQNAVS